MADTGVLATLHHPKWGACDLVRVEGTDWIVRLRSNGKLYRFPPQVRGQFQRSGDTGTVAPSAELAAKEPSASSRDSRPPAVAATGPPAGALATVRHPVLGIGDLVRVEISDWIIR